MKKLFLLSMVLCVLTIGCQKDGVYNPQEKIKRIYVQYQGYTKNIAQEWTWDKNLLTKIQFYYNNSPSYDQRYKYEKKRLVKVENNYGDYYKISYSGNNFDKIEGYDVGGKIYFSAKYTYDKNKISKIEITSYDDGKSKLLVGFLSNLFSQELMKGMERFFSKSKSKSSSETYSISYTYDKNNIKEMITEYREPGYSETTTYRYEKYDNKSNPVYGFIFNGFGPTSKNNPLEATVECREVDEGDTDFSRYAITYDYTYDGKFPIEVVETTKYDGGSSRYTSFYEYQK